MSTITGDLDGVPAAPLRAATRRRRAIFIGAYIVPLILTAIYAVTLPNIPKEHQKWLNGEEGPVENITAALFLAVGVVSGVLAYRLRRGEPGIPRWCRAWFWLFCIGGVMMCGEEISWGQHYFGWSGPDALTQLNKQQETNLHNLAGDKPARLSRRVADIGLPIFAIILPIIFAFGKDSWARGNWPRYLLPRWELTVWIGLAILVTPVRKWLQATWPGEFRSSLSEYQELLWAGALLVYVIVMWRRLMADEPREHRQ